MSVSKEGYKERCARIIRAIEALHENGAWETGEMNGSELEIAREVAVIVSRTVRNK